MRVVPAPSTAPAPDSLGPSRGLGLQLLWLVPEERTLRLIDRDRIVVGRAENADWVLGGTEASRQHAVLHRIGPVWIVRDLGSTNGTFVNGERVHEAPLGPGTVLRIGDSVAVAVLEPEADHVVRPLREVAPDFYAGASLQHLLESSEELTRSDLPLIIEGETGSGKERVARYVHLVSGRSGPFVALNCAALPETLAEAELFGYRKGAFTGAAQSSEGYFRAAHGGSLLLDEILDLSLPLQAKLLRAIERREVTPIGEATPIALDVRILAASQAPLEAAVRAGTFRGDLWARLDGLTLRVPPLRERVEDIARLFLKFLEQHCGGRPPVVEARLLETLCLYEWPFNVRELELLARRMAIAHGLEPILRRSLLPARLAAGARSASSGPTLPALPMTSTIVSSAACAPTEASLRARPRLRGSRVCAPIV